MNTITGRRHDSIEEQMEADCWANRALPKRAHEETTPTRSISMKRDTTAVQIRRAEQQEILLYAMLAMRAAINCNALSIPATHQLVDARKALETEYVRVFGFRDLEVSQ